MMIFDQNRQSAIKRNEDYAAEQFDIFGTKRAIYKSEIYLGADS